MLKWSAFPVVAMLALVVAGNACAQIGDLLVQKPDAELSLSSAVLDSSDQIFLEDIGCEPACRNLFLRARGGVSYFDVPSDSRVGGTYALDAAMPLFDAVGVYASGSVNHFSGGSQFLGTTGFYKQASGCSADICDRFSLAVLLDQFSDTRFDDPYLAQIRYSVGFSVACNTAVGLTYSDPLSGDEAELPLVGGGIAPFSIRTTEALEAWVSTWVGNAQLTGVLGYRDDVDAGMFGLGIRVPIQDRVTTYLDLNYDTAGFWAAGAGMELRFGSGCGCGSMILRWATT